MTNESKDVPQDRTHINVSDPTEVRYWTEELDVSATMLISAVTMVGNSADAVRRHLAQGQETPREENIEPDDRTQHGAQSDALKGSQPGLTGHTPN